MDIGFAEALTIVGLLSIAVLSLGAGMALDAVGVVAIGPRAHAVVLVVEVVLLVTFFSGSRPLRWCRRRSDGTALKTVAATAALKIVGSFHGVAERRRLRWPVPRA